MAILSRVEPAVRLMNRLKYPQKFILISFLFCLPIALLSYFLLSELHSRIEFSQKEIYGTFYLRPLAQLLEKTESDRINLSQCRNSSDYCAQPLQFIQHPQEITQVLADLNTLDQQFGSLLETSDRLEQLDRLWRPLLRFQDNQYFEKSNNIRQFIDSKNIDQIDNQLQNISARIHSLVALIGDTSNLILDPDLDSYYLMDAVLIKLPELQDTLTRISISQSDILLGRNSNRIQSQLEKELLQYLGQLNSLKQGLQKGQLVAINHNPLKNIYPALDPTYKLLFSHLDELMHRAERNKLDREYRVFLDLTQLTRESSLSLWEKSIDELEFLLENRVMGFRQRQQLIVIVVVGVLLLVVYLLMGFYLSVIRMVQQLAAAAEGMSHGKINQTVRLEGRDELSQVVHSFNTVASALVTANQKITSLNEQLKEENMRMQTELEITRRLQKMILPKEEELNRILDLEIAGYMEPATEVGGDYYDVIQIEDRIKIGMGDVTGHGLESGMLMVMVQMAVRTLLSSQESDPKKFLGFINQAIYSNVQRMNSDKNMTLVLLDYQKGCLSLTGQHEEIILVRSNGDLERIDTMDLGFPVGLEPEISDFIDRRDVLLRSGDVVVLYTDGIPEAENTLGQHYGMEQLCKIVQTYKDQNASRIRQAIVDDLRQFIGSQKIYDDITLLVLKQR